jgi:hypothetical protein
MRLSQKPRQCWSAPLRMARFVHGYKQIDCARSMTDGGDFRRLHLLPGRRTVDSFVCLDQRAREGVVRRRGAQAWRRSPGRGVAGGGRRPGYAGRHAGGFRRRTRDELVNTVLVGAAAQVNTEKGGRTLSVPRCLERTFGVIARPPAGVAAPDFTTPSSNRTGADGGSEIP